jgi:hypothetical protein
MERDRMVLSLLEPEDRTKIEEIVEEILDEALSVRDAIYIEAAAGSFDERAEGLPNDEKLVAWQIAAALRQRANPAGPPH